MSRKILSELKRVDKLIDKEIEKREKYAESKSDAWLETRTAGKYAHRTDTLMRVSEELGNIIFQYEVSNGLR